MAVEVQGARDPDPVMPVLHVMRHFGNERGVAPTTASTESHGEEFSSAHIRRLGMHRRRLHGYEVRQSEDETTNRMPRVAYRLHGS